MCDKPLFGDTLLFTTKFQTLFFQGMQNGNIGQKSVKPIFLKIPLTWRWR